MDRFWRHGFRAAWLVLVLAANSFATAQTTSFEEGAAILGASCGKDIDDNCRGVNLDPTRLKECLSRNQDVVSAQCKADYGRVFTMVQQRAAARASFSTACERDAAKLCPPAEKADELQGLGSAK